MLPVHTIHLESVDSTRIFAKERAQEFDPKKLTCITAKVQTKGFGRYGRPWVSKPGNLHMTLFFLLDDKDPILPNLGQILALAAHTVLKQSGISTLIKWPNDLLLKGKKLAGTVVDVIPFAKQRLGILLSIGLNVSYTPETDQPTTCLADAAHPIDLETLAKEIVAQFQVEWKEGFHKEKFLPSLAMLGETISLHRGEEKLIGILKGLSNEGRLLLETERGIEEITSGEISTVREGKGRA